MTEEEATQRWCPFARGIQDGGGNRMAYGGADPDEPDCSVQYGADMADLYPCIGSACMAWRWLERAHDAFTDEFGVEHGPGGQDRGYCGLAGKL